MPTFHSTSYLPPKSAKHLKKISINFPKGTKCMWYVRFMLYVRPLKNIKTYLQCLQTNTHHAARKSSQPGSVTWCTGCGRKMWLLSHLFSHTKSDFLSNVRSYNNIWMIRKMFLKLHANFFAGLWSCTKFSVQYYNTSDRKSKLLQATDQKYNNHECWITHINLFCILISDWYFMWLQFVHKHNEKITCYINVHFWRSNF